MANQFEYQEAITSESVENIASRALFKRVREIINQVDYKPHTGFRILRDKRCIVFLQHVQFIDDCTVDDDTALEQRGRKFYISRHMTDEEIVRTASLAVQVFECHESHEWFRYQGKRYLNPHPEGQRE